MKLNIYNETWDIKELNEKDIKEYMVDKSDGERYWGACDTEGSEIRSLDQLGPQRKRQILIHEVVHAIRSMELLPGANLSTEELPNFVAFHIDEINKVVKEYFKPKKRKTRKIKEQAIIVPAVEVLELP